MSNVAVLLVPEDGSKWASETLEQVCRQIFDFLKPQVEYGPWLTFSCLPGELREIVANKKWLSKKPRDYQKIVSLRRALAEQVLRSDGFVLFHLDGDVPWGDRSSNLEDFDEDIRSKVRELVRLHTVVEGEARIESVMSRLILVSPYYSIEAWLFANVAKLRDLGVSGAILDEWRDDPSKLDRWMTDKKLLSVDTRHYPVLARELHAAGLYQLQGSFTEAVNHVGACGSLIVRLRHHWPAWVRNQYSPDSPDGP